MRLKAFHRPHDIREKKDAVIFSLCYGKHYRVQFFFNVRAEKCHNIGDKEDHVDSQRPTMGKRNAFQILFDGARKSTLPNPFDFFCNWMYAM
jgi:hypothetical protein